jgi:hypothetical protein
VSASPSAVRGEHLAERFAIPTIPSLRYQIF